MKHIISLPPDGKENEPRRIDYNSQYRRYATYAAERVKKAMKTAGFDAGKEFDPESMGDSVLSSDWHPFYDSRGVKFYHNFLTGERMRQSPRRVPNTADQGAPPAYVQVEDQENRKPNKQNVELERNTKRPLALTGFNAVSTGPRAKDLAAQNPENRDWGIRAPHRIHMPNEVPIA